MTYMDVIKIKRKKGGGVANAPNEDLNTQCSQVEGILRLSHLHYSFTFFYYLTSRTIQIFALCSKGVGLYKRNRCV